MFVVFVQVRARDCVGKLTAKEGKGGGMLDKLGGAQSALSRVPPTANRWHSATP